MQPGNCVAVSLGPHKKGAEDRNGKIHPFAFEARDDSVAQDLQDWENDCQEYNKPNRIVTPPPLKVKPESRKTSPRFLGKRLLTHHTTCIFNLFNASPAGLVFANTVTSSEVWTVGANDMARLLLNCVFSSVAHCGSFFLLQTAIQETRLSFRLRSGRPSFHEICTRAVKHRITNYTKYRIGWR